MKASILLLMLMGGFLMIPGFGEEIHHLARTGDVEKMKDLLELHPAWVNSKDAYGWTPLQIAALMGQGEVVKLLVEKGADLNAADRFGFTALHLAALGHHNAIVELLVENGAVVKNQPLTTASSEGPAELFSAADVREELTDALLDDQNQPGRDIKKKSKTSAENPYVFVMMSLKEELIEVDLARSFKKGEKAPALTPEAFRRLKELAEGYISRRSGIKSNHRLGNTLLHTAAQQGDLKKVESLLRHRKELLNSANIFGITPLHYAAIGGYREIAARLIAAGAVIDARTKTGITVLYGAVSAGKYQMVDLLVSSGAKVDKATQDGAVPLHAVTTKEIARRLVAAGARVDVKNKYGFTPLHIAAHYGHVEVAEYLLSRGALLESRTDAGWTPLCEAIFGQRKAMVDFLVSRGANVNVKTKAGSTPLEIAANFRYREIAQTLKDNGAF